MCGASKVRKPSTTSPVLSGLELEDLSPHDGHRYHSQLARHTDCHIVKGRHDSLISCGVRLT
jgi:hypothetical protein